MKNKKRNLFFIAVILNLSAFGQVTVTCTAYAEIVAMVTAKETVQLNFGRFSPGIGDGSITISPEGARLASGSATLIDGPFSQGAITVTGSENGSISVLLPTTQQLLHHFNSDNTIYLDKWTYSIPKTSITGNIVNIGATLHFGPVESNPVGNYSGTFQIILFYN